MHQETTTIESYDALRIANEDAIRQYVDVSDLGISIRLLDNQWHVEYSPLQPNVNGGGPHYVIDAIDGTILEEVLPMTDDYDSDEVTHEEWMLFVAQGLAEELADPREDIYTLEDGESISDYEPPSPT